MTTTTKGKATDQDRAEAAALIKIRAAREAVADTGKTIEAERAKLAAIEAQRADLPLDDATIREHIINQETVRARVVILEKRLAAAETALAGIEAEVKAEQRGALHRRAVEDVARVKALFDREYAVHAEALADLFVRAAAAGDLAARANAQLPDGAERVSRVRKFMEGGPPNHVVIMAVDGSRRSIWAGDQFADCDSDVVWSLRSFF